MNTDQVTFARLRAKLKELGFTEYRVAHEGKSGYRFERPDANIWLPDYADEEVVPQADINHVVMVLKSPGLLPESNPLLT
jgi:hypothetical protein